MTTLATTAADQADNNHDSEHVGLRLAPIDRPRGVLVRLFNWMMRLRFGKVMMPSRVIYSRWPTLLWRQLPLYHLLERGLTIDHELRHLIEVQVSILNGCTFCADLHHANAKLEGDGRSPGPSLGEKLRAHERGTEGVLHEREQTALAYVTEITRDHLVSDATFAALKSAFTEKEIIEITWVQAFTTYLNRMAVPLGIGSDGFCAITDARMRGQLRKEPTRRADQNA